VCNLPVKDQTKASKNTVLDVRKIVEKFQKSEGEAGHGKDPHRIEWNFENAVRKIAKAKPKKPSPASKLHT
jgi:hypothetical protein